MTGADDMVTALYDGWASNLDRIADALERGADPVKLAAVLREGARTFRAEGRPPLLEAEVRHAGARLRAAQDPRAVFPDLGRDLHAAGGGAS